MTQYIATCVICGQPVRDGGHVDPDRDLHRVFAVPDPVEPEPAQPRRRHAFEPEWVEGSGLHCRKCGWLRSSLLHMVRVEA